MAGKMSLGLMFLLLWLLPFTNLFSEEVSFIARKDYFVGLRPFAVVIADFNRDGHLDLATANLASHSVTILLGDGSGRFERVNDIPISGLNPLEIVIGDFNEDGHLDLAVANSGSNDVSILLGNGEGAFDVVEENFPVSGSPRSIAVGDFNNDGHLDVATADQDFTRPPRISVLLGDGSGRFSEFRAFDLDEVIGSSPNCLKVGDFNSDGNLDLVVANQRSPRLPILFGDGTGDFNVQFVSIPCEGWESCPRAATCLEVDDFNGDNKPDLVMIQRGGSGIFRNQRISIWYGDGKGGFITEAEFQSLDVREYSPVFLTTADLNNDDILDIVLANQPGHFVSVLLRDGQEGFTFGEFNFFASGFVPEWIAVGDFNEDENHDLAVANVGTNPPDKTVSILLGDGQGGFIDGRIGGVSGSSLRVVKGDFNNDANLDLVVGGTLVLGDGQGGFGEPRRFAAGSEVTTAGDFNNDGNLDLAGPGSIFLGDGKGNLTLFGNFPVGVNPSSIIAEDFNGDGNLDLAISNQGTQFDERMRIPSTVSIFLGDGKGNFSRRDFTVGVAPISVVAGDFNHDGNIDLAVGNVDGFAPNSTISILLGDGAGGFETAREINIRHFPVFMTSADFNKDGNLDLAVSLGLSGSTQTAVLLGDGEGGFSEPRNFEVGITPRAIVAGDFDGDGNLDLAVVALLSRSVSILLGDGQGGFRDQIRFGGGGSFGMVEGDFNNDGKLDLVIAGGGLWLLINDTEVPKDKSSQAPPISFGNGSVQPVIETKFSVASANLESPSTKKSHFISSLLKGRFFRPFMKAFR